MSKLILFLLSIALNILSQELDGNKILEMVDQNILSRNKIITSQMIIHGRRASRTIESKSWIQGTQKSFTEYLAPAREKGTKMLKLEDQLWTYSPSTDRIIRISGHMLRQSVMGSDLSYEDMMEDPKLQNLYEAAVIGRDTLLDRPCFIVQLQAKVPDAAYYSRKMWVDTERYMILKEERYAKSGKLLKTTNILEIMQADDRWVAKRVVFKDALNSGKGTEFIMKNIRFDADIPETIFSKAALKK